MGSLFPLALLLALVFTQLNQQLALLALLVPPLRFGRVSAQADEPRRSRGPHWRLFGHENWLLEAGWENFIRLEGQNACGEVRGAKSLILAGSWWQNGHGQSRTRPQNIHNLVICET
jgi:hypothetical protein